MADSMAAYQSVPPPQCGSEANSAFADALKRAKEIAARMGSGPPSDMVSNLPYQEIDSGRKRLHTEDGDDPLPKKLLPEIGMGMGMPGPDLKDPKSIALQVAASIAQRAGLGSMTTEELKIPNKFVGLVIGRGGEQINKLQSETGARIQVAPDPPIGVMSPPDRAVTINGSPQAVEKAKQLLHKICEEGKIPDSLMSVPTVAPGETVTEMMIPASKVGLIIGKGGETIKSLQERAQCRMVMIQDGPYLNAPEKPLRIMGDPTRCQRGKDLVNDLLTEKEIEQITPSVDFGGKRMDLRGQPGGGNVLEIPVPREVVGFVIGRSGETIKRIQAESGARLQFSPEAENPTNPNRIATVQGTPEQIRQVHATIEEIIQQSRQRGGPPPKGPPPNMPGVKTVEAPVPGNKCGLIIGKGGETIRQIIQQSGAHVELNRNIPENSPTKYFVIRGTDAQIQQAQNMIREKIEDPRGGGGGGGGRGRGGGGNFGQKWNQNQQNSNSNWNQNQQQQQQQPQQPQQQQQQQPYGGYPYGQQQQQFGQQEYSQQQFGQQQFGGQPGQQAQQGQQAAPGGASQDYSAAWAAYYQQYYQQQAAVAAATGQQPTQAGGGQPDYTAAWNQYFKQQQQYQQYYQQPGQQQPGQQPPGQQDQPGQNSQPPSSQQ